MITAKKLPIGIENFQEIRTEDFYYVDKTGLIIELLNQWGKVNLFTRPRRFGKSLNMNMLKTFFEYGCDARLFHGLNIAEHRELCQKYMGRFPVISITLKGVSAGSYELAKEKLCSVIGREAMRFQFLLDSTRLSSREKEQYGQLINIGKKGEPGFVMSNDTLTDSLLLLSELLHKHYGEKVILLLDEYDVPLDKACQYGYYDEMILLIQSLFSQTLKSNDHLYFAVLTGCLRIAKESIFTGLNNLKSLSVTDVQFNEYFGFSDKEVRDMLNFYGVEHQYKQMKTWYDGYHFGNTDVYCPWNVINYIDLLRTSPDAVPKSFWINTSGNEIIRSFLQQANGKTKKEIERLVNGECITKKINLELTYRDLYQNTDNLWSVLFSTGYLTQQGEAEGKELSLKIPNLELQQIFEEQISEWFQEEVLKNTSALNAFCEAFLTADAPAVENQFTAYLQKTISIRDTNTHKEKKENFYHGILLGLLSHYENWSVNSNAESGDGFSDILIETEDGLTGIVIEIKYPDKGNLEAGCQHALKQIEQKRYEARLRQDGVKTIIKYGIACWKKSCMVRLGRSE